MDYLKRATIKNYSAWDLNVKCVRGDNKLERKFKRMARRKNKIILKNSIDFD